MTKLDATSAKWAWGVGAADRANHPYADAEEERKLCHSVFVVDVYRRMWRLGFHGFIPPEVVGQ